MPTISERIEALNKSASKMTSHGRYLDAIGLLDQALEIDPKNASIWYNKGVALYQLKRFGEALKCYDQALLIEPKFAEACPNLMFFSSKLRLDSDSLILIICQLKKEG